MPNKVFVVGVGMTKFEKPGSREGWDYPDMARESGTKALADASVAYTEIEQGFVGYVAGDSTCGQSALYELGMTGIPIVNVNNNCSTGSTALYLGAQSTSPPRTAWAARNSAVDPVEQLLLTLTIGIPVMPSS